MHGFILATDETPKLRLLAGRLPTPLAPLVDRPVIARVLELLARNGFKQASVGLYRMPGGIERYCNDGRRWGMRLDYHLQRQPLGSAGALKWAEASLTETFLVLPANEILDLDIAAARAFHESHGGLATAILAPARPASTPGALGPEVSVQQGRIRALGDEPGAGYSDRDRYLFTGAYIFDPQVLGLIPSRTAFDCISDLLPLLPEDAGLRGYIHDGYWNPLDTFSAFQEAQRTYLHSAWVSKAGPEGESAAPEEGPRVRHASLAGLQLAPGIWAGHNLAVHPSVKLAPPVYIGDNCQVGREVELGPFAVLSENVIVDDEATVRESVVLKDTYVGRLLNVEGRIIDRTLTIDAATGAGTVIVDRFLLAETTPSGAGAGLARLGDLLLAALLLLLTAPVLLLGGLIALLSSLAAGQGPRAWTRVPRVGCLPGAVAGDDAASQPLPFDMLCLATRRAGGDFTPMGRFLERSELNRLPVLWNVVRGDLRIVGVQPLTEEDVRRSVEDWQRERLTYPAGFTGLWYTQAPRGADLDTTAITDAYYIATRTWWEDLRILGRTPFAWAKRVGTRTQDGTSP